MAMDIRRRGSGPQRLLLQQRLRFMKSDGGRIIPLLVSLVRFTLCNERDIFSWGKIEIVVVWNIDIHFIVSVNNVEIRLSSFSMIS